MKNRSFTAFDWQNGQLYDYSANQYPTRLHALVGENTFHFEPGSSYFLFAYDGFGYLDGKFPLPKHHYAVATEKQNYLQGSEDARILIIERIGYGALFSLGGPIEATGRLKYIDGCTDSLLIAPVKIGDPCFNHLHFPPAILQTMHTHPSMRVGVVAKGNGDCVTPYGKIPLFPGQIFIIHEDGEHCFQTFSSTMDVIAYHPDSDFGPKDEDHPMVNRTIVNGISAKNIDEIRTR